MLRPYRGGGSRPNVVWSDLEGRAFFGRHQTPLPDVQPAAHVARILVEGRAIGAGGITLCVIEHAPLSLAFAFGGFGLLRRAFHLFLKILLKLLPPPLWVTTAAREKGNQQENGYEAHLPNEMRHFSSPLHHQPLG